MSATQSLQQMQEDAVKAIGNVSTLLRNALGAAFPPAPEQYLTIAIPGTVIDLTDVDSGGSLVWDVTKHAFPPTAVQQGEAKLVDNMMPIANIMIGNTGKSVARSYSRALDSLLPKAAIITTADEIRSPGNPLYNKAMAALALKDSSGLTPVDYYVQKQAAWSQAQTAWEKARQSARQEAQDMYPPKSGDGYIGKQAQYYNDWNQKNYLRYKTEVQGKYMDWVVNGQKYNVEYNFGLIDVDSIMQRIEASKESMRNSILVDSDGVNTSYMVTLEPKQWATYCKLNAEGWYNRNGYYTLGQIDNEIERLQTLQQSYQKVQSLTDINPATYPTTGADAPETTRDKANTDVATALEALYKAQATLAGDRLKKAPVATEITKSSEAVRTAEKGLKDAKETQDKVNLEWAKHDMATLDGTMKASTNSWITSQLETISTQLVALQKARDQKAKDNPVTVPIIVDATAPESTTDTDTPTGAVLAKPGAELANAMFGLNVSSTTTAATTGTTPAGAAPSTANPFTNVSFSYSAADQTKTASSSSMGFSIGGSVGFGLWSVGGSYSHSQSQSDMQADMASCDVSISFSALVVNINRPWLYGELFSDFDLEVPIGVHISPGALELKRMIAAQDPGNIAQYAEFPAYPTAFIVAADTTIEFTGNTSHIEQHFSSHSNSGGLSVGYGPWSVSSSFSESASKQSMQMHTTATGCKLSFGAPQIIGYVSQILPELPRTENFNPLTQGSGIRVPS